MDLKLKSWDPVTGYLYERGQFRAADLIREIGGDRTPEWYLSLDPECETGKLHILNEPQYDRFTKTNAKGFEVMGKFSLNAKAK